ncbi:hypothetical protein IGI04_034412 [Brassica rapa subsp. trilocularis]|uniref:Zinc finger GRF-type domain-containing protein n=1 Tax=Brassica rapa subsp. trilocularis TaxID=1813537 RepID=A0ABQ7L8N7_BRACM|nr:hypothetical protein IGI04_034412 [Brassica rapa subsp. trilocularis]
MVLQKCKCEKRGPIVEFNGSRAWNSRRCDCGAAIIVLIIMSNTARNPERRFYRCGANSGQNHIWHIKSDLADMKKDISEIVGLIECLRMKS